MGSTRSIYGYEKVGGKWCIGTYDIDGKFTSLIECADYDEAINKVNGINGGWIEAP